MSKELNSLIRVGKAILSKAIQIILSSVRGLGLSRDVVFSSFSVGTNRGPRVFNLDVHTSIIADLGKGAEALDLSITTWSISGGNRVFRKLLWVPDPVHGINASSWASIGPESIAEFTSYYRSFLQKFDGFIATYPPAFAQIYEEFDKPVLAVAGTRYEWPLTLNQELWSSFDGFIQKSTSSGALTLAANNLGDADYLEFSTGVTPKYVPSLCDYTGQSWNGLVSQYLVVARSEALITEVGKITNNLWVDSRSILGKNYRWSDLAKGKALFVVPYNISTMSLFELSTMGVPVIVPSGNLLKTLRQEYTGVLSELSFMEMNSMDISGLEDDDPNNYLSHSYLDWWIDRADFYNSRLMPNVFVIDRLEELNELEKLLQNHFSQDFSSVVSMRNNRLQNERYNFLRGFVEKL